MNNEQNTKAPASTTASVDTPAFRELLNGLMNEYWAPDNHIPAIIAHIDAHSAAQVQAVEAHLMQSHAPLMDAASARHRIATAEAARAAVPNLSTLTQYGTSPIWGEENEFFQERPDGGYVRLGGVEELLSTHAAQGGALTDAQITTIIRDVAELPDRDSPADQPDMMLVSADELRTILAAASKPVAETPNDRVKAAIVLTGYQLAAALDLAWPDRETDHEQGETEIGFWNRSAPEAIDGHTYPAGVYAYWVDLPEEGSVSIEIEAESIAAGATASVNGPTGQEPVAYVNGDELDNMLDDRTAIIQSARSGHRATPLYAGPVSATPASAAQPGERDAALSKATADVLSERRRQIENENWSAEHDDRYSHSQLPRAAAAYAFPELTAVQGLHVWPWADSWWKPREPRFNCVRAAALLIAEIERMDRAAMAAPAQGEPAKPCSQDELASGRASSRTCLRCGLTGPCTGNSSKGGSQ